MVVAAGLRVEQRRVEGDDLVHAGRGRREHHPGDEGVRAVAREAHGSPFFAMEIARAMLRKPRGAKPPTLQEALASHVGMLPGDAPPEVAFDEVT